MITRRPDCVTVGIGVELGYPRFLLSTVFSPSAGRMAALSLSTETLRDLLLISI